MKGRWTLIQGIASLAGEAWRQSETCSSDMIRRLGGERQEAAERQYIMMMEGFTATLRGLVQHLFTTPQLFSGYNDAFLKPHSDGNSPSAEGSVHETKGIAGLTTQNGAAVTTILECIATEGGTKQHCHLRSSDPHLPRLSSADVIAHTCAKMLSRLLQPPNEGSGRDISATSRLHLTRQLCDAIDVCRPLLLSEHETVQGRDGRESEVVENASAKEVRCMLLEQESTLEEVLVSCVPSLSDSAERRRTSATGGGGGLAMGLARTRVIDTLLRFSRERE